MAWRIQHLCAFQSAVDWFMGFNEWAAMPTSAVKAFRVVQDAMY